MMREQPISQYRKCIDDSHVTCLTEDDWQLSAAEDDRIELPIDAKLLDHFSQLFAITYSWPTGELTHDECLDLGGHLVTWPHQLNSWRHRVVVELRAQCIRRRK